MFYIKIILYISRIINNYKMKKITIIIKQLIKIITFNTSYPYSEININSWDYEFKNGICVYNQYRTLMNYLKDN